MHGLRITGFGVALLVATSHIIHPVGADPAVPVRTGSTGGENCYGVASVQLRSDAGRLNLRAGPGAHFPVIGRLGNGQKVSVCGDWRREWVPVVVHAREAPADCGLSDMAPGQVYEGPCQSGWVARTFLQVAAG